jgi:hypothetical protein
VCDGPALRVQVADRRLQCGLLMRFWLPKIPLAQEDLSYGAFKLGVHLVANFAGGAIATAIFKFVSEPA